MYYYFIIIIVMNYYVLSFSLNYSIFLGHLSCNVGD